MSRIVADADGLIKLGKSGALGALLSRAEVLVPEAVYKEAVVVGKKEMHEDAFELERVLREGGARIVSGIDDERAARILEGASSLGAGERAALHAAFAAGADTVLTDDRAFLGVLTRAGVAALVPAAAMLSLAEAGAMSLEEAVAALGKIEGSVRREVYETAMQELETIREERR
jgi:predicted nucleic acid-binding protein